jgi:hypothetical protein
MSNWTVTDWLTYVPFILGALLLAVIQEAKDMTNPPSSLLLCFISTNWNYVPLVLMLIGGGFFGLRQAGVMGNQVSALLSPPAYASTANLQLHMYGDQRMPSRISATGIWRGFFLRTLLNTVEKETGAQIIAGELAILFITFDPPVNVVHWRYHHRTSNYLFVR